MKTIVSVLVSIFVCLLPEETKQRAPFNHYSGVGMHVFSGLLEFLLSTAFLFYSFSEFADRYGHATSSIMSRQWFAPSHGTLFGIGAIGYVSFALQPSTMVAAFCLAEGSMRAINSAMTSREPGIAFFWVVRKTALFLAGRAERAGIQRKLGPARPDEVCPVEKSASGMLEIYMVKEKPWSDRQSLKYKDEFYALSSKSLQPRGPYWAYRYCFRKLHPSEVIRGRIVEYGPSGRSRAYF